jgi:hypothetical protein
MDTGRGRCAWEIPTQAKGGLEWGTVYLLSDLDKEPNVLYIQFVLKVTICRN